MKIDNVKLLPCVPFLTNGGPIKTNSSQDSPSHFSISILAKNRCDTKYTYGRSLIISFDSVEIMENRTYKLGNSNFLNGQVSCRYSEELIEFGSDSTLPGTITVQKFNPQLRVISASFEASLKDFNSAKIVTLKEGKFDIIY